MRMKQNLAVRLPEWLQNALGVMARRELRSKSSLAAKAISDYTLRHHRDLVPEGTLKVEVKQ